MQLNASLSGWSRTICASHTQAMMLAITSFLETLTTLNSTISSLPMSKLLFITTYFFRLWQITDCLIICWTFNKPLWSRDFWISSEDIWISYHKVHDAMHQQNIFIFCIKFGFQVHYCSQKIMIIIPLCKFNIYVIYFS